MPEINKQLEGIQKILVEILAATKANKIQQGEIMNISEAAEYLKVTRGFIYRCTSIPKYQPSEKLIRYRKTDLDKWLNSYRVRTQEEIEEAANEYLLKRKSK
jgi:excisionase family DNA binding protein